MAFKDNSYNEILIQKRSKNKEPSPGKLCTPGGHLNKGETYLQGAKREFFEEMHHESPITEEKEFQELFKIKKKTHQNYEFITVFRLISDGPFKSDPSEVEDYYFENIEKIMQQIKDNPEMFTQTSIIILKEYAKRYITS